jgi:hypothetical protein
MAFFFLTEKQPGNLQVPARKTKNGVTYPRVVEIVCASPANMGFCGVAIYASSHLIQYFD